MHAFALAVLLTVGAAQPSTWYDSYERGVRLIQDGQPAAAIALLETAIAQKSTEALQAPTRPQQYIDYIPHLYLAIAFQNTGNLDKARKHLELAENSGVAAKSEVGRALLVAYQLLLRGDALRYPRPAYATYSDKTPLLSEAEFTMLRDDVLKRCDLPAGTNLRSAPWYANYELGLELERKGDYPRALQHFIDAVASRPNPQKQARMYGMWLVDYYPYFHIARSHARLENWECAKNALDISQRLREIPATGPEMNEWTSLRREAEQKVVNAKN
jgi:tetratricopeptide (TPR) repeat protein